MLTVKQPLEEAFLCWPGVVFHDCNAAANLLHNLVLHPKYQMKYMSQRAKVSPLRISFHIASISILNILRLTSLDSAGNLSKHFENLLEKPRNTFYLREEREVALGL